MVFGSAGAVGGFGAAGVSHDSPRAHTCTFEGLGASNTTKIPREDTQRDTKKSETGGGRRKKSRNFGPSTLRGHDTHQIQKWIGQKWIGPNWSNQDGQNGIGQSGSFPQDRHVFKLERMVEEGGRACRKKSSGTESGSNGKVQRTRKKEQDV